MTARSGAAMFLIKGATPAEYRHADIMQECINSWFWRDNNVTDPKVTELLQWELGKSRFAPEWTDYVHVVAGGWRLGLARNQVYFRSGRRIDRGDVLICAPDDEDNKGIMPTFPAWCPRLMHEGVVDEDDVDIL